MGSFLSNASRVDPKSRLYKSLFLIHFHRYYFTSISFSVWIWFWLKKEKKKTYIPLGMPIWISLSLNGYIFHPTTFSANFSIGAIQNIFFKHEFLKTLKRFNIQQRYTNTFTLKMTLTKFKLKRKKNKFSQSNGWWNPFYFARFFATDKCQDECSCSSKRIFRNYPKAICWNFAIKSDEHVGKCPWNLDNQLITNIDGHLQKRIQPISMNTLHNAQYADKRFHDLEIPSIFYCKRVFLPNCLYCSHILFGECMWFFLENVL